MGLKGNDEFPLFPLKCLNKAGVEDPLKKTFQEKQRVRKFSRCAQVFWHFSKNIMLIEKSKIYGMNRGCIYIFEYVIKMGTISY